jgi:hypothetical protein
VSLNSVIKNVSYDDQLMRHPNKILIHKKKKIPEEYLTYFNVTDEIVRSDPMEVEEAQQNLYITAALEWHD